MLFKLVIYKGCVKKAVVRSVFFQARLSKDVFASDIFLGQGSSS